MTLERNGNTAVLFCFFQKMSSFSPFGLGYEALPACLFCVAAVVLMHKMLKNARVGNEMEES